MNEHSESEIHGVFDLGTQAIYERKLANWPIIREISHIPMCPQAELIASMTPTFEFLVRLQIPLNTHDTKSAHIR